jgi:NH3-dependent NAD+ synthetase
VPKARDVTFKTGAACFLLNSAAAILVKNLVESTITKAPSAELRRDQTDQDSLPPYDLLDEILELHVEQCRSAEEIIAEGYDEATVRRVLRLVRIARLPAEVRSRGYGKAARGVRGFRRRRSGS